MCLTLVARSFSNESMRAGHTVKEGREELGYAVRKEIGLK